MSTKYCGSCDNWLTLEYFHKGSGKHGRASYCKSCMKEYQKRNKEKVRSAAERWRSGNQEYMRQYREQNREQLRDYHRQYHQEHAEQLREWTRQWRKANPQRTIDNNRNYYKKNRERELVKSRSRHQQNRQANCERARQWRQDNKDRVQAQLAKRRCAQKCAIPPWVDFDEIESFYTEASQLTEQTSVSHQVDHTVPLNSDVVCGLHCADNLRVVTAEENNHKKNRLDESLL